MQVKHVILEHKRLGWVSFMIDEGDAWVLQEYTFRFRYSKHELHTDYIYCRKRGQEPSILLHRLLLNCGPKDIVDHINGNGLDNCRENLRIVNHQQNNAFAKRRKDNTSGYKGVHKTGGKFMARIQHKGKRKCLGLFKTPEEAYTAYRNAYIKLYREEPKNDKA